MSTSSLSVSARCRGGQSLEALLNIPASQLRHADIAEMNLLCATGLPGAENLSVGCCLATLDAWARRVRRETDRHLYRFRQAPAEFNRSEGYFRMLMLVTVLQQDFGVRYNPDRIRGIDFRDSRDLFIHGLLEEPHTGTCASMPVLYVAAGRRLGYPLRLVLTHGHVFARWDSPDGRDRFNVECASRGMLSFPDEYYKTWPTPLTDEQVRKGRYLLSLGAAEELAVFVESRGHCLLDNGRIREARMAYEHACRLDPLSPGHWGWLADARVREASLVPHGGNLNTFSNWGCSMTISCLPIANSTLSAEPVRAFPLDSTRYRNYHQTLGRWIERDPIGYGDGLNLVEYGQSAPACVLDPMGTKITSFSGCSKQQVEDITAADAAVANKLPKISGVLGRWDLSTVIRLYVAPDQERARNYRKKYGDLYQTYRFRVLATLGRMKSLLDRRISAICECECEEGKRAFCYPLFSSTKIHFCPSYFEQGALGEAGIFTHELSHLAGVTGEYDHSWNNPQAFDALAAANDAYHYEDLQKWDVRQILEADIWQHLFPSQPSG